MKKRGETKERKTDKKEYRMKKIDLLRNWKCMPQTKKWIVKKLEVLINKKNLGKRDEHSLKEN